jgi:hypothetical protein
MGDNCANYWGCSLADINTSQLRRSFGTSNGDNHLHNTFKQEIAATFNRKFSITCISTCGSEANLHAVVMVTDGDTNRCLIAAGSYVAGNSGPLQTWSTSEFSIKRGLSGILPPSEVKNKFTLSHTIPLPYSIKGVMGEEELKEFENKCMKEVHVKCLMGHMQGLPYTCIMLELMLASNGAELSDRALTMLGNLAEQHNLSFVVDEIMTGGRCGSMLMLLSKPLNFLNRVSHVTLGKWLQLGLVLSSSHYCDLKGLNAEQDHTTARGASTKMDVTLAHLHWSRVKENLNCTEARRESVVSRLKLEEGETWGTGCLIFAPVCRNGTVYGLKNRLLPQLEPKKPIERSLQRSKMPEWSKAYVTELAVEAIRLWLYLEKDLIYEDENVSYYNLVLYLSRNDVEEFNKIENLQNDVFSELGKNELRSLLRRAEKYGLLSYKMVGLKRLRFWVVNKICSCNSIITE